jgi:cytochrome c2
MYQKTDSILGKMHVLWTLEGMGKLTEEHVLSALSQGSNDLRMHAARLSWRITNSDSLMKALIQSTPPVFDESSYYLLQRIANFSHTDAQAFMVKAYMKWASKPFIVTTILSGSADHIEDWIAKIPDSDERKVIQTTYIKSKQVTKVLPTTLTGKHMKSYDRGKEIYEMSCFSCHGKDGLGLLDMGPPLANSDWVSGSPDIISKIILKGMEGEITVSGKKYTPKVSMMPFEAIMTDEQIADVSTYIRNSWDNKASPVDEKSVHRVRAETSKRTTRYQEADLR